MQQAAGRSWDQWRLCSWRPFDRHPLGKNHVIILRICDALHPRATLHPHSKVIYFPVGEFWAPASFPENLQHLRWAPVGLLLMNFGLRLRFPENLQHLRWAPVWAPPGLLWVPAIFL